MNREVGAHQQRVGAIFVPPHSFMDHHRHHITERNHSEWIQRPVCSHGRLVEPEPGTDGGSRLPIIAPGRAKHPTSLGSPSAPPRLPIGIVTVRVARGDGSRSARRRYTRQIDVDVLERGTFSAEYTNRGHAHIGSLIGSSGQDLSYRSAPAEYADVDVHRTRPDRSYVHRRHAPQRLGLDTSRGRHRRSGQRRQRPAMGGSGVVPSRVNVHEIAALARRVDGHLAFECRPLIDHSWGPASVKCPPCERLTLAGGGETHA